MTLATIVSYHEFSFSFEHGFKSHFDNYNHLAVKKFHSYLLSFSSDNNNTCSSKRARPVIYYERIVKAIMFLVNLHSIRTVSFFGNTKDCKRIFASFTVSKSHGIDSYRKRRTSKKPKRNCFCHMPG